MECGGFTFFSDFDSGNLARIEVRNDEKEEDNDDDDDDENDNNDTDRVSFPVRDTTIDRDFLCWTTPDCAGTEFENGNRTWFYFGMKSNGIKDKDIILRFTFQNLNKQFKLFSQGFSPVYLTTTTTPPSSSYPPWKRIRDVSYKTIDNQFYMSFRYKLTTTSMTPTTTTYFAFTYPFSFNDLQNHLTRLERRFSDKKSDSIYFQRRLGCYSYEKRRVDVLTISGTDGILENEYEDEGLVFQNESPIHKFRNKKYVFLSSRVHPGETQSSFVLNGFLKFLLRRSDPRSIALRKRYVFKIIPMLNPDGVVRGHYRTDSRGINLNRVYGNPDPIFHPSIFYAKRLILYVNNGENVHHEDSTIVSDHTTSRFLTSISNPVNDQFSWYEMTETSRFSEGDESIADFSMKAIMPTSSTSTTTMMTTVAPAAAAASAAAMTMMTTTASASSSAVTTAAAAMLTDETTFLPPADCPSTLSAKTSFFGAFSNKHENPPPTDISKKPEFSTGSRNLFLYVDIHGHASKRGIFMYGNHFTDPEKKVDSMLLPKLMSLNCANFDFPACNFTHKNMYLKDRHTGAGREGCGRVSVFKATGLVYSYTLEANFNTGRETNTIVNCNGTSSPVPHYDRPPEYTPLIYEDAGKAVATSILDLTDSNPSSRVSESSYKNLKGVKDSIRRFIKTSEELSSRNSNTSKTEDSGRILRRTTTSQSKKKVGGTSRNKKDSSSSSSSSSSTKIISKKKKKRSKK